MPPRLNPDRPMTTAERQERARQRKAERVDAMRWALERIAVAKTVREARAIAEKALTQ